MAASVHHKALCESTNVGNRTRVWAFAHILPGARIGDDCNICDHVFIENDVVVGDRVTVKSGVQLWDGVRLDDDVFVGPNATFTNDRFPRSRQHPDQFPQTVVRNGASIGANATILPGIQIGSRAMVGAGTVVTRNVPANAIVIGNPARITGYVDARPFATPSEVVQFEHAQPGTVVGNPVRLRVSTAALYELPTFRDLRGSLSVATFEDVIPFQPRRFFVVHDVPGSHVRGAHSHQECHQFLVCISGHLRVMLDDGYERVEVNLDRPGLGLHIPPLTWAVQYRHSADAALLVFASHEYDDADYIRDYDEFTRRVSRTDTRDLPGDPAHTAAPQELAEAAGVCEP